METFAADLRTMVRTPLTEADVAAIRKIAAEQVFEPGDMVQEAGVPLATFNDIVEGEIEAIEPATGNGMAKRRWGRRSFLAKSIFSMAVIRSSARGRRSGRFFCACRARICCG